MRLSRLDGITDASNGKGAIKRKSRQCLTNHAGLRRQAHWNRTRWPSVAARCLSLDFKTLLFYELEIEDLIHVKKRCSAAELER